MKNSLFEGRERERKVAEIVRHFLRVVRAFNHLRQSYQGGTLRFAQLARLVDDRNQGLLFALKENCQSLFRRPGPAVSEKEQIFDLTVGALFHLAMKAREDLYQLEFYGPKYAALEEGGDAPPERKRLVNHFRGFIFRAQNSLREGMEEIFLLLGETLLRFQDFLREHRENGLLVRFFLEEKGLLREVWGENAQESLFDSLYGPGSVFPFRRAGQSYLAGGFFSQAAAAFSLGLEKNPADEGLRFMHHLSRGMEQFYSFSPLPALESLEICLSFSPGRELQEEYGRMIHSVCRRIQGEFPGRRKSDKQQDPSGRARVLQRQLEKILPPPAGPRKARARR